MRRRATERGYHDRLGQSVAAAHVRRCGRGRLGRARAGNQRQTYDGKDTAQ